MSWSRRRPTATGRVVGRRVAIEVSAATVEKCTILCRTHIIPGLGARKLRELSAADVDRWLEAKAKTLSTRTLGDIYQCLNRVVKRAMARELVARNVVDLCGVPRGQPGRRSKSLTLDQAVALLAAAERSTLRAYVVLSLMIGARTEELRALRWDHVDLDGDPAVTPPQPPSVLVWRSVREGGDTKTKKSRRSLALPRRCVDALRKHREDQQEVCAQDGRAWNAQGLVFATRTGTALSAGNVRRSFRRVVGAAGLEATAWTPRELRHSFVSLLSAHGVTVEQIADLVGHAGTTVTEAIYRHELRPVLLDGARVMDKILGSPEPAKVAGDVA